MKLIGNAVFLGIVLSIMTGPIFFTLIDTSIRRGFKAAIVFCSGVWISDIFYILLIFLGLSYIKDLPNFNFYIGLIGGIILITFGVFSFFHKSKFKIEAKSTSIKSNFGDFFKGVAINVFNPFVILFWIGVLSNLSNEKVSLVKSIIYLAALLMTVAVSDIYKAYLAEKIRDRINPYYLNILNYIVGSSLIIFGLSLIYKVW